LFNDGGVAVVCNINNLTMFKNCTTIGIDAVRMSGANSIVDFNGSLVKLTSTTPSADFYAFGTYGASSKFYNLRVVSNCLGVNISINTIEAYNFNSISTLASGSGFGIKNIGLLRDSYGESNGGFGIHCVGATETHNCMGRTTSGTAIRGGGTKLTGVATTGYGIIYQGSNLVDCMGISTSGVGISSAQTLDNLKTIAISSSGRAFNGNGNVYNSLFISQSANGANLDGVKVYNSTIITNWNNAGAIAAMTPDTIVNCSLRVANLSASCIGGTATTKYANNSFEGATTPVAGTITQGISNTADSQGNILI